MLGSELPFEKEKSESGFDLSSSGVRVGKYYWMIGGGGYCPQIKQNENNFASSWTEGIQINGNINTNSYMWSIEKRTWFPGPDFFQHDFIFHYACSVSLNSTAVLFIGLTKGVDGNTFANYFTAIYNFGTKAWTEEDSISYDLSTDIRYPDVSCCVNHGKTQS